MKTNLLVTGRPGVGKTTAIIHVLEQLRGLVRIAGFITKEVRAADGARIGFQISTVDGRQAELARVGLQSTCQIGLYGVNLDGIEQLAVPVLARRDVDLIVVDEIGKMECASERFRASLMEALSSGVSVLATLGLARSPFFLSLRQRPDVELLTLTERNRDIVVVELCARFRSLRV